MNTPAGGSLTDGELDRVGQMLAEGRMRSDPPVLSPTDQVMDMMIERRNQKKRSRRDRPTQDQPTREPTPSRVPSPSDQLERDWRTPRTLDELLEIRRGLLGLTTRSDKP